MNTYWERIIGVSVVIPALIVFIEWQFPNLSDEGKFILGIPMGVCWLVATVWPERKGVVWPSNTPTLRRTLRIQRYILASIGWALLFSAAQLYAFVFPVPVGFQTHTPRFLPSDYGLPSLIIGLAIETLLFLVMLRHHIRSLPPKKN